MVSTSRFVTFYSYKGGVGRTSALVNAAILCARAGNRVVIIDFDLEAPGVAGYLRQLDPQYNQNQSGILEYLYDAINTPKIPSLRSRAIDLTDRIDNRNGGSFWSINAGSTEDKEYMMRLESLKWREIFANHHGELLLRNLKQQIAKEFDSPDYVFIDSRTGITETGGVCTRYLADDLVVLTSLNEQNINGTAMVYQEFQEEGKETILVASNVPVGMPSAPGQIFNQRVTSFKNAFGRNPDLFIYYHAALSLTECLPAAAESDIFLNGTDPLLRSYSDLASRIEKPRGDSYSFLGLIRSAAAEFRLLGQLPKQPDDSLRPISILRDNFSDRLLARFLIELDDFVVSCIAKKEQSPDEWNRTALSGLQRRIKNINNEAITEAYQNSIYIVGSLIMDQLTKLESMKQAWEIFLSNSQLDSVCNLEISLRRYAWPIEYLTRLLKSENSTFDSAANTYNLAHCLWETGQKEDARALLLQFVPIVAKIDIDRCTMSIKANVLFCLALAKEKLGDTADALKCIQLAQVAAKSTSEPAIFSPIDYRYVRPPEFRKQVSDAHRRLARASKSQPENVAQGGRINWPLRSPKKEAE